MRKHADLLALPICGRFGGFAARVDPGAWLLTSGLQAKASEPTLLRQQLIIAFAIVIQDLQKVLRPRFSVEFELK